jgi:hypothetical protein
LKVTFFGDTTETKSKSQCLLSTVTDLLGFGGRLAKSTPYKAIIDMFQAMGYQSGLTMQIMPYDWRLDAIINTKYQKNLEKSIRKMRKITGKKVTLIAHSYGNINVYFNLMRYFESKADRQHHVNSFIALAPPFGGLILGTKFLIGASPMWTY